MSHLMLQLHESRWKVMGYQQGGTHVVLSSFSFRLYTLFTWLLVAAGSMLTFLNNTDRKSVV